MKYHKLNRYKYQTDSDEIFSSKVKDFPFEHELFDLYSDGTFWVRKGYCWDGLSGPTWDTKSSMLPSLFHDAGYQAIRMRLLPITTKSEIDLRFYKLMLESGMNKFRAKYCYQAVKTFGFSSCRVGAIYKPEVIEV